MGNENEIAKLINVMCGLWWWIREQQKYTATKIKLK